MTLRDNPVQRLMVVRKICGKLVVDVQGTVRVPIKLKPIPVPASKTQTSFPAGSVAMGSPDPSSL
jgi:hypothetical protein